LQEAESTVFSPTSVFPDTFLPQLGF